VKPFLALETERGGSGHLLRVIWRAGEVVETVRHYPWFVANVPVKGPGVAGVERLPGYMLLFSPKEQAYRAVGRAYKIMVEHKKLVPRIAAEALQRNARGGMYNIVYEFRAAYDLQEQGYGLLGLPTPLAFLHNRLMTEHMEEAMEKAGDLKVMAMDIEVYSRRGGFPAKGDPILAITYASFRLRTDLFTREWPEENIQYMVNEDATLSGSHKLVREFAEAVKREEPDIIVTYNGSGFDFPYMAPFAGAGIRFRRDFLVVGDRYIPHVDLLTVRERLGPSLGLRSHAAYALDDVALEATKTVAKYRDMAWLFESRYIEAERKLDHAKLKEYFDRRDPLVYDYIVADVYLTSLLARLWLYPFILLAALTGSPINALQHANTGQIAEYALAELLRRLHLYPELRSRQRSYSRVTIRDRSASLEDGDPVRELRNRVPDFWVFERGKVYVRDYGYYGGNGKKIVELDFAQLYPTDMVVNPADPTSMFILEGYRATDGRLESIPPTIRLKKPPRAAEEQAAWSLLARRKEKRAQREIELYRVAPGYGPVAWLIYKLYVARKETKNMKKRAKAEKRPELMAPDQAVKIFNNSVYGAFNKSRGSLVHELLSATVFWRTQKLLYEVIRAVETVVAERLGRELTVLYGDTDSTYILVDEDVDGEEVARAVNDWIRERYGPAYKMELEGEYAAMLIPRRKRSNEASAKSYLLVDWEGRIVKATGDFYKLEAPLALKERLAEFYEELLRARPRSIPEVEAVMRCFLEGAPGYKLFIKKSVSGFVNEDDPRRYKTLNREFHYAALVELCESRAEGATVVEARESAGGGARVRCRLDLRRVEETQKTVIVFYLPHLRRESRRFIVYRGESSGTISFASVEVASYNVVREPAENREGEVDKAVVIEYIMREYGVGRDRFIDEVLRRVRRTVTETVYEKMVRVL